MKLLLKSILLIFTCLQTVLPQSGFQQFINRVNSIQGESEKSAVVDSFMNAARSAGIPFIEGNTANFIYRGNANRVQLAGDFTGWNPSIELTKLNSTNFFYYSAFFESNARLDYKFILNNSSWILDPENPNRVSGGFGPNSELAMSDYVQPWEIKYNSEVQHGSVKNTVFSSSVMNKTYSLYIYLPPGYDENVSVRYPSIYLNDGGEYISLGSAATVFDNLLDSLKIQPLIGVFVVPKNRNEEYASSERENYAEFFANELVPFIDSNYRTIQDREKRVVAGTSFGGNISALISWRYDAVFANCGLHSAAFWPNNYEVYNMIISGEKKDIKYVSVWGTYESLFTNMRNFRDTMISKGYLFDWAEFPEGHSWGLWRANIDKILEFFSPPSASNQSDGSMIPEHIKLYQNFPNPFNPTTTIKFTIGTQPGFYERERFNTSLKIYNLLGQEIRTLLRQQLLAGEYEIKFDANDLPSGMYVYHLSSGEFSGSHKMMLIK